MLGEFFENEGDNTKTYYKVIHTIKEYNDGKKFPIDEKVTSKKKIDLTAIDRRKIGGFCVSTSEYIFRWLIRGDTLCEVKIPENAKIYKTISRNGIYIVEEVILSNPKKIDDNVAMELYLESNLSEIGYFEAMTACAICGYINTALKVFEDKINKDNVDRAILEFENYCKRREKEKYEKDILSIETVKTMYNKLKCVQSIKNNVDIL